MISDGSVFFSRSKNSNAGDCSSEASDVWDDTLLVEAYEKATKTIQAACKQENSQTSVKGKKGKKKETGVNQWKVGDRCKCRYSSDLKYYEADIIGLDGTAGTCTVRYVGYENEEEASLSSLRQSDGDQARLRQSMEADCDNVSGGTKGAKGRKNPNDWNEWRPVQNSNDSSLSGPPGGLGSIVPPPPPPNLFRNICEDEAETEAMSAMLISWYMSGYHTGYYQGLKMAKKKSKKS